MDDKRKVLDQIRKDAENNPELSDSVKETINMFCDLDDEQINLVTRIIKELVRINKNK